MSACEPHSGYSRRGVVRGAVLIAGGVLLGGSAGLRGAREAQAAEEPRIFTRAEWGARKPATRPDVIDRRPDHIVVHHTATANTSGGSREQAFALSRGIQDWHMDHNGWWDAGQHLTISRGGHIMEGRWGSLANFRRGRHVVGAHTANHNSHTIGIENEGTYGSADPPRRLLVSLADTIAWLCTVYGLDPEDAIVGHRDFNATECPGDRMYAGLPRLRRQARERQDYMEQRLERLGYSEVPEEFKPTYPDVPANERTAQYYHGPALGERERGRA